MARSRVPNLNAMAKLDQYRQPIVHALLFLIISLALVLALAIWRFNGPAGEIARFAVGQWLALTPVFLVLAVYLRLSIAASFVGALALSQVLLVALVALPMRINMNLVHWVVASAISAAMIALILTRFGVIGSQPTNDEKRRAWGPSAWLVTGLVLALWAFGSWLRNDVLTPRILLDHPENLDWIVADTRFFEVLANGLAGYGLGESGIVAGSGLRYHVLTYAYVGGLNEVFDLEPFSAQRFIVPALAAVAIAVASVGWARRISGGLLGGFISAALVLIASSVALPNLGGIGGEVIRDVSPSSTISAIWLIAAAWLIVSLLLRRSWLAPIVALLGSMIVTGGKVTSGLVLVGLIFGLLLYGLRRKALWRISLVTLACSAAGLVLGFVGLASGQTTGGLLLWQDWPGVSRQVFNNPGLVAGVVGLWFATWFAFVPRWSGLIGTARRGLRVYFYGGIGIGLVATGIYIVFSPESVDRGWVMISAAPIMGVFAGVGLSRIWHEITIYRTQTLILVGTAVGAALVFSTRDLAIFTEKPILFSMAVLALALVTGFVSCLPVLRSGKTGFPIRLAFLSTAIPLSIWSVVASVAAPLEGSQPRTQVDSVRTTELWRNTEWLAEISLPEGQEQGVLAVWSDDDLWAPALIGLRSFASDSYAGLGGKSLEVSLQSRQLLMKEWAEQAEIDTFAMCRSGVTAAWTTDNRLWPESEPSIQQGIGRLWWLNCPSAS